jgi:glycerate-2-kinase
VNNTAARELIDAGCRGEIEETPDHLANVENIIIGDSARACVRARHHAEQKGYHARVVSTAVRGEARTVGITLVEYARYFPRRRCILVSGGETTVAVTGSGTGGRNQEMVLAAVPSLDAEPMVFLSCGTDGIDGTSPAAGVIADGQSAAQARKRGLSVEASLMDNDSHGFFHRLGDAIMTGYTGTNVMDLQIIVKL